MKCAARCSAHVVAKALEATTRDRHRCTRRVPVSTMPCRDPACPKSACKRHKNTKSTTPPSSTNEPQRRQQHCIDALQTLNGHIDARTQLLVGCIKKKHWKTTNQHQYQCLERTKSQQISIQTNDWRSFQKTGRSLNTLRNQKLQLVVVI